MLTNVRIKNFRVFENEINVRVRPVTILIGRNNCGKSSLVKFLLMLRQSIESTSSRFLVTEGTHVHLGSFRELKNDRSNSRSLTFHLDVDLELRPLAVQIVRASSRSVGTNIQSRGSKRGGAAVRMVVTIRMGAKTTPAVAHVDASVRYDEEPRQGWQKVLIKAADNVLYQWRSTLRHSKLLFFPVPPPRAHGIAKSQTFVKEFFTDTQALQDVRANLINMSHIGAIRAEFQRTQVIGSQPRLDVGESGQYALTHLRQILDAGGKAAAFVRKHVARVTEVERLQFGTAMKGYLLHCRARNAQTHSDSSLADFGFGVSQSLPVILQAAMLPKQALLLVQQPEAHLHPTAQLAMGDVFAEAWTERKVASIIETHSANILLRIRHLIARDRLDPKDVAVAYFFIENGKVRVRNLDILAGGKLEKGLPMEFFGGDIIESLDLISGK